MDVPSEKLKSSPDGNFLLCEPCTPQIATVFPAGGLLLGRDFDYDFSYSRKDGLKAEARLGKAVLSLHVPQEELIKVLG